MLMLDVVFATPPFKLIIAIILIHISPFFLSCRYHVVFLPLYQRGSSTPVFLPLVRCHTILHLLHLCSIYISLHYGQTFPETPLLPDSGLVSGSRPVPIILLHSSFFIISCNHMELLCFPDIADTLCGSENLWTFRYTCCHSCAFLIRFPYASHQPSSTIFSSLERWLAA